MVDQCEYYYRKYGECVLRCMLRDEGYIDGFIDFIVTWVKLRIYYIDTQGWSDV